MIRLAFSAPVKSDAERQLLLENLGSSGYEGVQLKMGDYLPFVDDPEKFLQAYPAVRGRISACIAYAPMAEEKLAIVRRIFPFAAAVGAELVVFVPGESRAKLSDSDLPAIASRLDDLAHEAKAAGTKLSLHHHHDGVCMHRADFDVYFKQSRSFGLTIDTAHAAKSGIADIAALIRDHASMIDNYHMKDFADGQFKVLGEGAIDFAPIFRAIKDTGYQGWVSADEESGGDLVAGMKICAAYLKHGLGGK